MTSTNSTRTAGTLISGALLIALAGGGSAFALGHTVVMGGAAGSASEFSYTPPDKTIYKGDTVTFHNGGTRSHSATAGTGPTDVRLPEDGGFDTQVIPGATSATTAPFDEVGIFPYFCKVQPSPGFYPHFNRGMKGKVRVLYRFGGFQPPVDEREHAVNTVKAGQSVALKFSLDGDQGMNIFKAGYPASRTIPSASGDPAPRIETPGASGLSYDATTDTYTVVWKTDKSWAGTSRKLLLRFDDGAAEPYEATFHFTR